MLQGAQNLNVAKRLGPKHGRVFRPKHDRVFSHVNWLCWNQQQTVYMHLHKLVVLFNYLKQEMATRNRTEAPLPNLNSTNIFLQLVWGPTARFKDCQCFLLYSISNSKRWRQTVVWWLDAHHHVSSAPWLAYTDDELAEWVSWTAVLFEYCAILNCS